jgi:hypothetical protein
LEVEWDDVKFYLYRRSCYLDQLVRLYCENKEISSTKEQRNTPKEALFDCLIVVGLHNDEGIYKPFIKHKYPRSVR